AGSFFSFCGAMSVSSLVGRTTACLKSRSAARSSPCALCCHPTIASSEVGFPAHHGLRRRATWLRSHPHPRQGSTSPTGDHVPDRGAPLIDFSHAVVHP